MKTPRGCPVAFYRGPVGIDAGRRLLARALAAACLAGGLVGLSAPSASAADDYPWAWQGQCLIVPQEPIVEPTPTPTPTPTPGPGPDKPGGPGKPGETEAPAVEPPPPPPPPVFDPVSGQRALRISYAGPTADIEAAIERLARWLPRA